MTLLDRISLILTILGGINWLLVGLFQFDLVAYICGGQGLEHRWSMLLVG